MSILTEVEYIDGVQEFLEEEYVTELLEKSKSSFVLSGVPVEGTIRFSGDTSMFTKQVYSEKDLSIAGSWFVDGYTLKTKGLTSMYTYTYITYKKKATTKKEGLFSVDYKEGYLYTSTPIKDVQIEYKYASQYLYSSEMEQVDAKEYTPQNLYGIPLKEQEQLSFIYQVKADKEMTRTREFYKNGKISLLTLGDKDE